MGILSSMARNHLDRKRLKVVERELALMERCIKFAKVTDQGWELIKSLRDEKAALIARLNPQIYM